MRLVTALLLLGVLLPAACAQEAAKDNTARGDDSSVQQLVEKLRDLRPPRWSYSDLLSKSDLVVIAKVKTRSDMAWDDGIGGAFGKETTKLIASRLRVLSVLKGESNDEIDVMTLEWKPNVLVLVNHDFAELRTQLMLPSLVSTVIDGQVTGYAESQPIETYKIEPEYLLYLRRVDGNGYVPVTGQRYSGMSVRTLND